MRKFQLFFLLAALFFVGCAAKPNPAVDLIKRVVPQHADKFVVETISAENDKDVFEIEAVDGKIVLRGNNGVAQASALNYYLENYCNVQPSLNGTMSPLPAELTLPEGKTRIATPFEHRYIFNYCTYGYSMPWWDWSRWEEMIDYMALKGINMPLAIIGQEAVWYEVYKELGLNEQQLNDFFVGPAHLPWGWMGNIDGLAGPLPKEWFTKRVELQNKILARQRELGMKPVLQAFTGHVPKALKTIYPDAHITQIEDWAGIEGTMFLDPGDSLFFKIGKMFIEKQTEMFGTDHYYDADCFIEVDPPNNDPEYLAKISSTIYHSMSIADPEAIWVVQGWFLFFKQKFWQKEQSEAFFKGIPTNKVIVLDLYGEKNPTWDKTDAFYGQPWIWNVICNEDQKVNMSGGLKIMQNEFQRAYQSEAKNNLRGIGIIPEGVGYNDIVYDFIYDKAWNTDSVNVQDWVGDWAERRYGVKDPKVREAWELLEETVYGRTRVFWSSLFTTPRLKELGGSKEDIRHVRADINVKDSHDFDWDFDVVKLAKAADIMLSLSDELKDNPHYQFDLVNIMREMLHSYAHLNINNVSKAYANKDLEGLKAASQEIQTQLAYMDEITSSHPNFMLGTWVNDARSWGVNKEQSDYYERNARTIITIWQPIENGSLRDYANKQWGGLIRDYYQPRWALFCSMLEESLENREEFKMKDFEKEVRAMDFKWTKSTNSYPTEPQYDAVEVAKKVKTKYIDPLVK